MKTPPAQISLCLLMALFAMAACVAPRRSTSNEVSNSNSYPSYPAASPRTAAGEAARMRAENSKRLEANLSQYASPPSSSRLTGRPYINGKVIALSKDQEDTEYRMNNGLVGGDSNDAVARSPEEVGTVVLVKYRRQKFATYTTTSSGNIPGYVMLADLVIVDRTIGAVIYRKTFRGERPEEYVSITRGASEVVGNDPTDKISEFLEKLPHK